MKAVKKIERKYYKYTIADWVQPVLTSNTSEPSFVVSSNSGSSAVFNLFDNNASSGYSWKGSAGSFTGQNYWVQINSSNGLNVTNFAITNRNVAGAPQAIMAGFIQVSVNGLEWLKITDWTNSNTTGGATWNIPVTYDGYYKYTRLCVTDSDKLNSGNYIQSMEMKLTATQQIAIEATHDDYDDFVDNASYYLPKINNKYYGITG